MNLIDGIVLEKKHAKIIGGIFIITTLVLIFFGIILWLSARDYWRYYFLHGLALNLSGICIIGLVMFYTYLIGYYTGFFKKNRP